MSNLTEMLLKIRSGETDDTGNKALLIIVAEVGKGLWVVSRSSVMIQEWTCNTHGVTWFNSHVE